MITKLKERILGDYVIDPRHDLAIYNILVRDGFIPVALLLGLLLILFVFAARIVYGLYIFNITHIFYLAIFIILYYLYKHIPKHGVIRGMIFLIFIISLWLSMTMIERKSNEYIFILLFPIVTYNLYGVRNGTVWNIAFGISFLATIILAHLGILNPGYDIYGLVISLIFYSFTSFFSYYAEVRHSSIEKLILRQLYYDGTTGLPNRKMLLEDISHRLYPSLFILRIDNFHDINTFFGYSLGDDFLKFIGRRINIFSASSKMKAYNLSGGEFAFVLDMRSLEENRADRLKKIAAELIRHMIDEKYIHQDTHIPLNPYIGIAQYIDGCDSLISQADIALHHAIASKLSYHIYNDDDKDRIRYLDNVKILSELNNAIANGKIIPYFQAIIDNRTGKIDKYESLMRIIDDSGNPGLPGRYLEVAQKTNLYHELSKIMITKVFSFMESNSDTFSINISADDIYNPDFPNYLEMMMESHPSCCGRVILEIVESKRLDNYRFVAEFIARCKKAGYMFAIDDFGSGYSNFSHLTELKIDFIKFDGSLIHKIDLDPTARIVIKNIAVLCRELNIKTIAEFVDSEFIMSVVNEYGIDYSQGFIVSRPSPTLINR